MKKIVSAAFKDDILVKNPLLIKMIALCPALVITKSFADSLVYGIVVLFVLIISNLSVTLLNKFAPKSIMRIVYLILAAGFTAVAEIILLKLYSSASEEFCLYIPLVAVVCMILSEKNEFDNIPNSFNYGLSKGVGFTVAILILAFFRELFSTGVLFATADSAGIKIFADWFVPIEILRHPAGGFIFLGCAIALTLKIAEICKVISKNKAELNDRIARGEHETLVMDEASGKIVMRRTIEKIAEAEAAKNAPGVDEILIEDVLIEVQDEEHVEFAECDSEDIDNE